MQGTEYKIEVIEDKTGEIVKTLSYSSERDLERAYSGLMRNFNADDYTARTVMPQCAKARE